MTDLRAPLTPFLHELIAVVAAPTQVLSARSGDILDAARGSGQGVLHADVRVVSDLRLTVDGWPPEHLATQVGAGTARFTSVLRRTEGGDLSDADPQLRLDRDRELAPGRVAERLVLSSQLDHEVSLRVEVVLGSDFAAIEEIRVASPSAPARLDVQQDGQHATWTSGKVTVSLRAPGARLDSSAQTLLRLSWLVPVPAHGSAEVGWGLAVDDQAGAVTAARSAPLPAGLLAERAAQTVQDSGVVEPRLRGWLEQSLADLNSLRMTAVDGPDDPFFAAGAPWYLTLFGRDSLWTARMLLPLDLEHARGTLTTLARRQGRRLDPASGESPGKIPHELRRGQFTFGATSLPPLYYGTIDATPLWICLLHDAWRAGLDSQVVTGLLPALQAALHWLWAYGDSDGDGFLEYVDESGHGLANQGWKDSGDAVRFADGTVASGPVALCEVQGYAHQAAVAGADLLDAFGLPGGVDCRGRAADLARRFRAAFWCGAGHDRYPALALDGQKRRVDSCTSNIGHLLGTGLLDADEELLVARRLARPDLDSGLGLRTMSSGDAGYSPLSYHCGSVWPHDTAIVIAGMVRAGLGQLATGLVEGLLQASVAFDRRLPELWSGEGRPVPYPAACRPQAWSAAAAVVVAGALAGHPDLALLDTPSSPRANSVVSPHPTKEPG